MNIPEYLDRDDYLQNPIMKRFLRERKIKFAENRADFIKAIKDYANTNQEQEKEVVDWLLKVVKEGSKEFCYRKIYGISEKHKDPALVKEKIREVYSNCPMKNILTYHNTKERKLTEYYIITNEVGAVKKIEFTFSRLALCGETQKQGTITVFPIFVEVYIDEGFIVTRTKAKSTLYDYDEDNRMLFSEYKINTIKEAVFLVDKIIGIFGFETEKDKKVIKKQNSEMLYKLYQEYSFTPSDVEEKVKSVIGINKEYADKIFNEFSLDVRNKEKAMFDLRVFVEKYISINGNNEDVFKKDRDAYLIKVSTDDEMDLTKVDAKSDATKPLQCTAAFFDSKSSVVGNKKCNKINLIFKRKDDTYLKGKPLVIQFGTNSDCAYFKTIQYAEEADIQNVLQTIFTHY